MLPDFPETKRLFSRVFQTYMRQKIRQISPYSAIQTRFLHEGRSMKVVRADQTESASNMVQLSSALEIRMDEIEDLTLKKVLEKHDALIIDIAQKQTHFIRERMGSEIPDSQSVDAKGRKLDASLLIEVFEKMQIEFNPDGTPQEIHVDGPLFAPEMLSAIEEEFERSPELKKRWDDMMEKKKEDWHAREADRKLVG